MSGVAFSIRDLHFSYGSQRVLKGVSTEVLEGEMVAIIGPNGAGKSTLMRLLARFHEPREGSIVLFGKDLREYERKELARHVATLPQEISTAYPHTVEEFVIMGRYPHFEKRFSYGTEERSVVERVMVSMGIGHLRGRLIDTLSEGERQKVFLAQCLVQEPRVLLLDEPVSHLDIRHQLQSLELLLGLNAGGLTILMVLHDLNLASEFCSRILLLAKGEVFADGPPEATLTYETIEKAYETVVVVKENPLTRRPFVLPVSKRTLQSSRALTVTGEKDRVR